MLLCALLETILCDKSPRYCSADVCRGGGPHGAGGARRPGYQNGQAGPYDIGYRRSRSREQYMCERLCSRERQHRIPRQVGLCFLRVCHLIVRHARGEVVRDSPTGREELQRTCCTCFVHTHTHGVRFQPTAPTTHTNRCWKANVDRPEALGAFRSFLRVHELAGVGAPMRLPLYTLQEHCRAPLDE